MEETVEGATEAPGSKDGFLCRRCSSRIGAGCDALLVPRRIGELPALSPLHTYLVVCTNCVAGQEGQLGEDEPMPPIRLPVTVVRALRLVGDGVVYQRRKYAAVRRGEVPMNDDDRVTESVARLVRLGFVEWRLPQVGDPVGRMNPRAWAELTISGAAYLAWLEEQEAAVAAVEDREKGENDNG